LIFYNNDMRMDEQCECWLINKNGLIFEQK